MRTFFIKDRRIIAQKKAVTDTKNMPSSRNLRFRYEDILLQDIPALMLNIWSYSDEHGTGCTICTKYKKFCIKAFQKNWEKDYIDIDVVKERLKKRDSEWCNLSRISPWHRHVLYEYI